MDLDKVINIKCEAKSYFELDELNHFQGKLKSIDKDQFNKLKKSLVKDGLPIGFHVWIDKKDKVWTIDGHHRVLALKALREEGYDIPSLPCVIVQAKDKKEAAKAVLINNSKYAKVSQESLSDFMIDFELNVDDLNFLDLPDLNMDDFGLDEKTKEGLTDDDSVPEVAQNIHNVKLGDIYHLGNHRLMCGDSTSIHAVEKLMDGQKADMVFTDPPYGVSYTGGLGDSDQGLKSNNRKMIMNDDVDLYEDAVVIANTFCIGPVFMFYADTVPFGLYRGIEKVGAQVVALIIWKKPGGYGALGASYKQNHEPCVIWKNKKSKLNFIGPTDENRIWEIKKEGLNKLHPTQKPVEVPVRAISNHKADSVLDLFGGSGSTLIACEKTNRKCFMMELDPHYCSVIIERWQQFTGQKSKLITE